MSTVIDTLIQDELDRDTYASEQRRDWNMASFKQVRFIDSLLGKKDLGDAAGSRADLGGRKVGGGRGQLTA